MYPNKLLGNLLGIRLGCTCRSPKVGSGSSPLMSVHLSACNLLSLSLSLSHKPHNKKKTHTHPTCMTWRTALLANRLEAMITWMNMALVITKNTFGNGGFSSVCFPTMLNGAMSITNPRAFPTVSVGEGTPKLNHGPWKTSGKLIIFAIHAYMLIFVIYIIIYNYTLFLEATVASFQV